MARHHSHGFTLVELMITVSIIGILAGAAIPAFTKYLRRARVTEAYTALNKMWVSSVSYYNTDFSDGSGAAKPRQFPGPAAAFESNTDCGCQTGARCGASGVWTGWSTDPVWQALKFSLPDPHNFLYGYSSSGSGTSATFSAYARGNLDCDAEISEFRRNGEIRGNGDVSGAVQPIVTNELE